MNSAIYYKSTTVFYITLIIIVIGLSNLSTSKSARIQKFTVNTIIIVLSITAGLRGNSVGIDTANYLRSFERWNAGFFGGVVDGFEPGLYIVAKISLLIINNTQFVFIVVAIIINGLIIKRLWQLKDKISFSFAVFTYSSVYYFMTYSGIRQWIAVAIVFYSTKYLLDKKYLKFLLFVIVSALFHNSAFIALFYIPLDLIFRDKNDTNQNNLFRIFLITSPIIFIIILFIISQSGVLSQYYYLFDSTYRRSSVGLAFFVKLFIVITATLLIKNRHFKFSEFIFSKKITAFYVFGVLLSFPGYFYRNLSRVSWYYTIFEIVFFGMIVNTKRIGLLFRILTSLVIIYTLYAELSASGYGHVPYIPFWKLP